MIGVKIPVNGTSSHNQIKCFLFILLITGVVCNQVFKFCVKLLIETIYILILYNIYVTMLSENSELLAKYRKKMPLQYFIMIISGIIGTPAIIIALLNI
jgi:uncharacterized membrane protein YbjE (DUF340 family)